MTAVGVVMTEISVEGRPLDDRELTRKAKSGDLDAFEELVRIHQATALRLAFLVVRDRGEAEEAAQEAFVKAYRALHRFRDGAPFRPWLLTIVRNEAANRMRSVGRRHRLGSLVEAEAVSGVAAPSPETVLITREEGSELFDAVDVLPARIRSVVLLRHVVGLTEQETAAVLRVPVGTVKSRNSRGLARLKEALEKIDV